MAYTWFVCVGDVFLRQPTQLFKRKKRKKESIPTSMGGPKGQKETE
jgi:hypothetical protein